MLIQKTVIEGKYIDVIAKNNEPLVDPIFRKFKDTAKAVRTQDFMTHPVLAADGELCFNIQIMSKKKKATNFGVGFTNFDEVFL